MDLNKRKVAKFKGGREKKKTAPQGSKTTLVVGKRATRKEGRDSFTYPQKDKRRKEGG